MLDGVESLPMTGGLTTVGGVLLDDPASACGVHGPMASSSPNEVRIVAGNEATEVALTTEVG